jgi:signal transduction histidine kinase
MAHLDKSAAANTAMATVGREILTPLSGIDGHLDLLATSPLDARQRRCVDGMRVFVDGMLIMLDDMLEAAGTRAPLPGMPGDLARRIAGDWEALVWAVEDQEQDMAIGSLHSLKSALGIADQGFMASHCRGLERHLERHGFEGLAPVLYEFHLRMQTLLDEARSAAAQAGG